MPTFTGTITPDILIGTAGDDLLLPYGVGLGDPADVMSGLDGSDVYDLSEPIGEDPVHLYIIDDNGTDGAIDRIENAGELIHSASLGYLGFTTAVRHGDDLHIITPYKPYRFRDPSQPSYDITIIDHFAGEAVEWLDAGGTLYRLPDGLIGTRDADLLAGTDGDDVLIALGGVDYVTANGGDDKVKAGAGNDYAFGGDGNDQVDGQAGDDRVYGGLGNDDLRGGIGQDFLYGEAGNDTLRGQAGNDYMYGYDGHDRLFGGTGQDLMSGGDGNDRMFGGLGGDTYRYGYDIENLGTDAPAGHDRIFDNGEPATYSEFDRIELFGYYGPSDGTTPDAYARLSFAKVGQDMVLTTDAGAGSITVQNQFRADKFFVEELHFNAGYWTPLQFKIVDGAKDDIGDDRTYSSWEGGEWNEVLFGTDGDDQVFGNSGTNFIWLGAGADTLIYKEADPESGYGTGGGACNDIVEDFDITEDVMDFSELKGVDMSGLSIGENARGNATVAWDSGTWEVSDIYIELRGVSLADLTVDHFIFG